MADRREEGSGAIVKAVGVSPLRLVLVIAAALLGFPAAAAGVPDCRRQPEPRTILSGQGRLEAVSADRTGRLYLTDLTEGRVLRLDAPGARPLVLVGEVDGPGGLAFDREGWLYVGFGNDQPNPVIGNVAPLAGLLRVDPRNGRHSVFATGLAMANGVARGPDGAIYASNDFGGQVGRVFEGRVESEWARVIASPNGLVVDREGRFLYAAQTFQPAAIARVEIANPDNVTTYVRPPLTDFAAGLDGITRDGRDRLYVAANGAGEVWRVDRRRRICALWRGDPFPSGPSAVAFGKGRRRFPGTSLFVVTLGGELIELPGVRG